MLALVFCGTINALQSRLGRFHRLLALRRVLGRARGDTRLHQTKRCSRRAAVSDKSLLYFSRRDFRSLKNEVVASVATFPVVEEEASGIIWNKAQVRQWVFPPSNREAHGS